MHFKETRQDKTRKSSGNSKLAGTKGTHHHAKHCFWFLLSRVCVFKNATIPCIYTEFCVSALYSQTSLLPRSPPSSLLPLLAHPPPSLIHTLLLPEQTNRQTQFMYTCTLTRLLPLLLISPFFCPTYQWTHAMPFLPSFPPSHPPSSNLA